MITGGTGAASAGAPTPIGFAEAVSLALKHNPQLAATRQGVAAAEGDLGIARAERWPRLDAAMSYTRHGDPVQVAPLSQPGEFGRFDRNTYDAALTASLPLYAGGRIVTGIEIAEAERVIAQRSVGQAEVDLVFNVASTFSKILQLRALEAADGAAVRQLEEHRRVADLMVRAGKTPRVDLLKTDVRLAEVRQRLVTTQATLESAQALLTRLLGFDPVRVRYDAAGALEYWPVREGMDAAVARALRQRPDYLAQQTAAAQADLRVGRARGKRLPTLSLNGQYGGRTGDDFTVEEQWDLGLLLSFPLFDGGAITAEVARERARRAAAEERLRDLELRVTGEVQDAFLDLRQAEERLALAQASLEQAREALRVEQLRYGSGAGTSADVLDAQSALLDAEALQAQALFDHAVARAGLQRAAGDLPVAVPVNGKGVEERGAAARRVARVAAGRGMHQ